MILSERLKQHAIEFLTIENMPPIDIHRRMKVVHSDDCIDVSIPFIDGIDIPKTVTRDKPTCKANNTAGDQ